ncbi:hypothetical protein [Rickettsia endosymbiont of Gonocerus acuteangulatus]|uniref:hypothetical protein n=1 Tax=Rickettsia endosymbiont of Gonocerus acuteangulatus TaxID=3066266 RepID=UPI003132AB90
MVWTYENFINAIKERNEEKALRFINEINSKELNKASDNGYTTLMSVANKGLYTVCERLASKMTYEVINQVNNSGNTALSLAKDKNICNLLCDISFQKLKDKLTKLTLCYSKYAKNSYYTAMFYSEALHNIP